MQGTYNFDKKFKCRDFFRSVFLDLNACYSNFPRKIRCSLLSTPSNQYQFILWAHRELNHHLSAFLCTSNLKMTNCQYFWHKRIQKWATDIFFIIFKRDESPFMCHFEAQIRIFNYRKMNQWGLRLMYFIWCWWIEEKLK